MKYNETYRGSYCWVQVALWLIGSINKMVVKLIGSISSCISVIRCIHDYFSFSFTIASLDWKGIYIYTGKQGVFPSKLWGFPIKIEAFPWLSCHVSLKPILSPSNWRGFHQIGEVSRGFSHSFSASRSCPTPASPAFGPSIGPVLAPGPPEVTGGPGRPACTNRRIKHLSTGGFPNHPQ